MDATTAHDGDIVVSGNYSDGFTLTYSGTTYAGWNVPQATVDDSALTLTTEDEPEVDETGDGRPPLDILGTWISSGNNTTDTVYIVINTTWIAVVNGAYTSPITWTGATTIYADYFGSNGVITHDGAEIDWYYGTTYAGAWYRVTGLGNETQKIEFSSVPSSGTWTITTDAGTTSSLAYNADLDTIQAALDAVTAHPHDIAVTGDYSSGLLLTYLGTSYAHSDVSEATVDDSSLSDSASVSTVADGGSGYYTQEVQTM